MDISNLEELATIFTQNALGKESPKSMCFTTCYPLSLYLNINGIENSIRHGICENRRHFWIEVSDKSIIDPTVKQFKFGENLSNVYLGVKTNNYDEDFSNTEWFFGTYENWLVPYRDTFNFLSGGIEFDLKTAFKLNIKSAIILNNEIERLGIELSQSTELHSYFSGIYHIMSRYPFRNEYDECKNLFGFDRLLSKVIEYYESNS